MKRRSGIPEQHRHAQHRAGALKHLEVWAKLRQDEELEASLRRFTIEIIARPLNRSMIAAGSGVLLSSTVPSSVYCIAKGRLMKLPVPPAEPKAPDPEMS